MPYPCLVFCPYLPVAQQVTFADWELGPLESFEDRWGDDRFKDQATRFLRHFVGIDNKPVNSPVLLCRKGEELDGQDPTSSELRALELSLAFAFIDKNPRRLPTTPHDRHRVVTADNAEVHAWPIDLESGLVLTSCGHLVHSHRFGYRIGDRELVFRPSLDLQMPLCASSPDALVLTGLYETVLQSLCYPGKDRTGDRVRIAVDWFVKAWTNSTRVHQAERLVFLKTAFEAITGESESHKSARKLRQMFETLPDTSVKDSEVLVWSPKEEPNRTRRSHSKAYQLTDLEHWFMEFSDARNTIIHEGRLPEFTYSDSNSTYEGPFFFTAEFLLRGVIKVLLSKLGFDDAWRSERWRATKAAWREAGNR